MADFKVGDKVLYRVRDDLWLPSEIVNITPRRIVIKPHGQQTYHRNTTASQLRPIQEQDKKEG